MKKACLYIRVSTDEQADKGFSQRDQAERLQIHCAKNNIEVTKIIFEDYSAKTFIRPEWTKLLVELRKSKGNGFDYVMFTKWDRFSRNTADAYQMIRTLTVDYLIEPIAIEQPLDLSVPESKTILAVYQEAHLADGQHEPLISESLFYRVQEIIESRKRRFEKKGTKAVSPRSLALRGFLICPKCGKIMTGSASRGRHKAYYPYYHCTATCGTRFQAEKTNTLFERELSQYVPKPGMDKLFKSIICDSYVDNGGRTFRYQNQKLEQIAEQNKRKSRVLELLINKTISDEEYQQIKKECENAILRHEAELKEISEQADDDLNIEGLAELAAINLKNLPEFYATADSDIKRAIVGSIYPEKWVFDGEAHRTPETNEVFQLIYHINRKLGHKKSGAKSLKDLYSAKVHL